jgi:hypothetical protein
MFFQFMIVGTGNYAWINFVGMLPCLALFDDEFCQDVLYYWKNYVIKLPSMALEFALVKLPFGVWRMLVMFPMRIVWRMLIVLPWRVLSGEKSAKNSRSSSQGSEDGEDKKSTGGKESSELRDSNTDTKERESRKSKQDERPQASVVERLLYLNPFYSFFVFLKSIYTFATAERIPDNATLTFGSGSEIVVGSRNSGRLGSSDVSEYGFEISGGLERRVRTLSRDDVDSGVSGFSGVSGTSGSESGNQSLDGNSGLSWTKNPFKKLFSLLHAVYETLFHSLLLKNCFYKSTTLFSSTYRYIILNCYYISIIILCFFMGYKSKDPIMELYSAAPWINNYDE